MTNGANVNRRIKFIPRSAWRYILRRIQSHNLEYLRYGRGVNQTRDLESLVGSWLTLPDVAERLDVIVTRVHKMIKDRQLLDMRLGNDRIRYIPAEFLTEVGLLKPLRGTIVVLEDAGFGTEQIIRWLFTEDESLPGRPIDALRAGRKAEIRRRAQAMGW